MTHIVDQLSTSRLAAAAMLLLEAAREEVKESSPNIPTEEEEIEVFATALHTLLVADVLPTNTTASQSNRLPKGHSKRWIGVALGLAAHISNLKNPLIILASVDVCIGILRQAIPAAPAVKTEPQ